MTALRRSDLYNYGENVVLSSSLDGIDLFSSHDVDADSDDILKICRSVAFRGEKLVSLSFPYTNEYLTTNTEWETLFSTQKTTFFPSFEGCIVRVFYDNEKWWYITNHKLDAFNSHWGSALSFGEMMFQKISKEELELTLSKDLHYMFLVRFNSENEMTCRAPDDNEEAVFHVGTYKFENNVPTFTLSEKCAIPHPPTITFNSPDELRSYTENIHYSMAQGLVCITIEENIPVITKIYSTTYARLNKIRGSTTDIRLRYLELISSPKEQKEFYTYWSDHRPTFDAIENTLKETALFIYESYVTRFIKKQQIVIPPQEFAIMKKCHDWHHSNRALNRISYEVVLKTLMESQTHSLLQIVSFSRESRMMKESPIERAKSLASTTEA